jgi:hypothetical protein
VRAADVGEVHHAGQPAVPSEPVLRGDEAWQRREDVPQRAELPRHMHVEERPRRLAAFSVESASNICLMSKTVIHARRCRSHGPPESTARLGAGTYRPR